jgi:hypothetical protein
MMYLMNLFQAAYTTHLLDRSSKRCLFVVLVE